MTLAIHDNRAKFDRVLAQVGKLNNLRVTVGIHGDDATREDGGSNVMVGAVAEFGAPNHKPPVPQRAWLRPGIASVQPQIGSIAKQTIGEVFDGTARPDQVPKRMGEVALAGIQKRIAAGIGPALSAATIANRLRRTKKGRALVNRGNRALRAAINGGKSVSGFARFVKGAGGVNKFRGGKWVAMKSAANHARNLLKLEHAMGGRFTPLHDSGQLVQSIQYKVEARK